MAGAFVVESCAAFSWSVMREMRSAARSSKGRLVSRYAGSAARAALGTAARARARMRTPRSMSLPVHRRREGPVVLDRRPAVAERLDAHVVRPRPEGLVHQRG